MISIFDIAKVIHQANKAYCESLGDKSQVNWEDASVNIRESVIDGVRFVVDNPLASARALHNNWLAFKKADGWIYGEEKDPIKKTHPYFVPYEALPVEQQTKDSMFNKIVGALHPLLVKIPEN